MAKIIFILKNLNTFLHKLLKYQTDSFFLNLDPFRRSPGFQSKISWFSLYKNPYFLNLLLFIFINLYGFFGLCPGVLINFSDPKILLQNDVHIYVHQLFSPISWFYSDFIMFIANSSAFFSLVSFIFNPPIEKRFLMFENDFSKSKYFIKL